MDCRCGAELTEQERAAYGGSRCENCFASWAHILHRNNGTGGPETNEPVINGVHRRKPWTCGTKGHQRRICG